MSRSPFWHPFADMRRISEQGAMTITRGEGAYVFDSAGRRYLDATAGLWYCNIGHGRAEVAEAVAAQMSKLAAYSAFGDLTNPPAEELARRLAGLAPFEDAAVFFTSGGSDGVDTALKMIRRYWVAAGQPERRVVIAREAAYHGMHTAGTGLAGIEANRAHYGDLLTGVARVAWDSADDLGKTIEAVGPGRVAAFFCEPVIGAGGVFYPPPGYLAQVQQICRDTGVVLVADEVITGYGRAGRWFASQHYGLEPDVVITAKGLTSGYLPMGAVLASPRVAGPFYDGTVGMWRHGYTYSGHAAAAAAALANLDILERENLVQRAGELAGELAATLRPLAAHPLVGEIRTGECLLAAVQIDPGAVSADPGLPQQVVRGMRDAGVLSRVLAPDAIQVSPPFVITRDQLGELADGIRAGLDAA